MNAPDNFSSGDDVVKAQELALRYRCEFVDLHVFKANSDVLERIDPRLMFRYSFIPLEETHDGRIAIAVADPSQLMSLDEISLLLGKGLIVRVATLAQIKETLQRIDLNQQEKRERPAEEPPAPDAPDAPVCAPRKPRPNLWSGSATAIPEEEQ